MTSGGFCGVMQCGICGSNSLLALWRGQFGEALRCQECGVIHLRSDSAEPANDLYDHQYYARHYLPRESGLIAFFEREASVLAKELPRASVRALDVGCGIGCFLHAAALQAWNVQGVETSASGCDLLRERFPELTVFRGALGEARLPDGTFDLVTFWDVLAHVRDVRVELTEARRILNDNGLLVIKTPNRPKLVFDLVRWICRPYRKLGDRLLHLPFQIFHFTPDSLTNALRFAGFRVTGVRPVPEVCCPTSGGLSTKQVVFNALEKATKVAAGFESFVTYARKTGENSGEPQR